MFKESKNEQGTEAWFIDRLGKITASNFSSVITKTGKPSTSVEELVNKAVAELIIGEPEETFESDAMLRGKALETEALNFFNFTNDYSFKKCGFLDSGLGYGCSPDGLDYEKSIGLELKVPLAHNHLAYLIGGKLPGKYMQQVQGSMLVTGFKKWVFGSYHPSLPCFCIEVERNDEYINKMREILITKSLLVNERFKKFSEMIKQEESA